MDLDEIIKLMDAMEERDMTRLALKSGDVELELERGSEIDAEGFFPQSLASAGGLLSGGMGMPMLPAGAAPAPVSAQPAAAASMEGAPPAVAGRFITSPVVGTFYHAPAPGEPNFVKVGDKVDADTVVAIVEAMKVMNEVKAGEGGVVAEVLVGDGQPVEFGTKIFRIE